MLYSVALQCGRVILPRWFLALLRGGPGWQTAVIPGGPILIDIFRIDLTIALTRGSKVKWFVGRPG